MINEPTATEEVVKFIALDEQEALGINGERIKHLCKEDEAVHGSRGEGDVTLSGREWYTGAADR